MISYVTDGFKMIFDLTKTTPKIGVWGAALNIPQVIGGLIFVRHIEAMLVVATCVGSILVAAQMHKRTPFTRLTSIVHVVWLPLLPYLLYVLARSGVHDSFGYWLSYVVIVMTVSLIFDVRNLLLYALADDSKFEGVEA